MTTATWPELAKNLKNRRNLESALFPAEQIGCKDFPRHGEPQRAFEARRNQSRKDHAKWSAETKRLLCKGVTCRESVLKKIAELKKEERELWRELRPDLEGTDFHNEN